MILDSTYFHSELYLPFAKKQAASTGVDAMLQSTGENTLEYFIEKYERDFLEKLLGKQLAENFIGGLDDEPINPIWISLKNALYEQTQVKGKTIGFSPAANYVYFYIQSQGQTQSALIGEVAAEISYAARVSANEKLIRAWNEMCCKVDEFWCGFMNPNWQVYKDYSGGRKYYYRCFFSPINNFGI